ncbi:hypothetical protein ACRU44_12650 [Mycobacterium colombiense]
MAITSSSFGPQDMPPDPRATNSAAAVYGDHEAIREDRMHGIAAVAADHTSSTSGQSAIDGGFITGDHQWQKTAGKPASVSINNQGSGFPGFADEPSRG